MNRVIEYTPRNPTGEHLTITSTVEWTDDNLDELIEAFAERLRSVVRARPGRLATCSGIVIAAYDRTELERDVGRLS